MTRFLSTLILCVLLTACATVQPSTQQAELEVQQASEQFRVAHERGDAAALSALLTEDAVLMIPGMVDTEGRSAIQKLMQQRFGSMRIADFKIHRREISVIGDSAYELAWYEQTTRSEQGGFEMQGRYVIVWQRGSDDVWRVRRYVYNFSDATPLS